MRIAETGFREYDLRWRYPEDIDLEGLTQVGHGIGTQLVSHGHPPRIVTGCDLRSYSPEVKAALIRGLVHAGIEVTDLGTCLTPLAYFARGHLGIAAVAMVTASHNPNGWTGVKVGFVPPLTHGPGEMAELRDLVLHGSLTPGTDGSVTTVDLRSDYLADLLAGPPLSRPLRIVCATGNGTAGLFAPELLRRLGAEVIALHTDPDPTFPHYNPNPEAMEMLHDMAAAVRAAGADLALGFDGDGDRCGVVDGEGHEVFADKVGVLLARDYAAGHPGATFVADVKSTGLFASDPVLRSLGAKADYWRTGHSHMKARVRELGALAGFEKSGHYFLAPPIGRGDDCGLRAAVEICRMLDRHSESTLADLVRSLPQTFTTPTLSPACPDGEKYDVLDRIADRLHAARTLGIHRIDRIVTVNGARVILDHGGWALVRASSNTPNLVVVCESPESKADLRGIFAAIDAVIRTEPSVGAYDQGF